MELVICSRCCREKPRGLVVQTSARAVRCVHCAELHLLDRSCLAYKVAAAELMARAETQGPPTARSRRQGCAAEHLAAARVQRFVRWRRSVDEDPVTLEKAATGEIFRIVEASARVHNFHAATLAHAFLASGRLQNPLTRRRLTKPEARRLHRKLVACGHASKHGPFLAVLLAAAS